jgi:hypothetical protein
MRSESHPNAFILFKKLAFKWAIERLLMADRSH